MNNQSNEGTSRKRRNRTSSEGVAAKKNRQSTEKPKKAPPKLGKRELKKPKKKTKRSRRKTTGKRQKICQIFEKALTDSPTLPPIYHLFKTLDPSGTPRASLVELIRTLQISTIVKDIHFITQDAWKSITNITSMFAIEEDEPGHGLFLKYRPIYNPKKCTVYIDNLPDGCKKEKLQRLASCYGNVSDIIISRKGPRIVKGAKKPINVGSREKSFGFIRFVDEDSAKSMIEKFRLNDPSELIDENGVRKQGFYDLYAIKLLREIRFLRLRRRRRTLPQIFRLARLRSKLQALRNLNIACRKKKHGSLRRNTWKRNHQNNHRDKYLPDPTPSTSSAAPQPPLPVTPRKPAKLNPPLPDLTPSPSTSKNKSATRKLAEDKDKKKKNGVETPKKKNGLVGNNNKKKRKKRRKLKYGSRKLPNYIPGRSVQQYFERVQCFSMERYEELKAEYLNLLSEEKSKNEENQNNKN